jgi:glyoxylase-like metal-dependent hydrolase (beta-lactamase superfamily II)
MRQARFIAAWACLLIPTVSAVAAAVATGSSAAPPSSLPAPRAFPPPGTFPTTESVTLLDADPQATIHYTVDGGVPSAASPVFDRWRLIFIAGHYDGNHGLRTHYTIRAIAIGAGRASSAVSRFQYLIDRRDRTAYVSQEIVPDVRMIRDSDNDKMFLLEGAREFVLIDSGMGRGDLARYIGKFTGAKPLAVIFTHNHGDHIGQAEQFVGGSLEYIGAQDRDGLVQLLRDRGGAPAVIAKHVLAVHDGERINIGDRALIIYSVAGHTPGSMVIFDPKSQALFSGDAFGSNSPTIPDAAWMQFDPKPLDRYLTEIEQVKSKLGGRVKYVLTGHNDRPLMGWTYVNNLERAVQLLLDRGDAALVPSYRPPGLFQVIVGDRLHDPNWVAINVNRAHYLPARAKTGPTADSGR